MYIYSSNEYTHVNLSVTEELTIPGMNCISKEILQEYHYVQRTFSNCM